MSVKCLAPRTARLIHSTQLIPSFEAAVSAVVYNAVQSGAKAVLISASIPTLTFTVSDNGRGFSSSDWPLALQSGCTSRKHGRGQSLAALAAVSSVTLHTRCGSFRATKLVRNGVLLHDSLHHRASLDIPFHENLQSRNGTVVEVSHLFHDVPVRRRVEVARDPGNVADSVRSCLVVLALANPHISVLFEGSNGLLAYNSAGSGVLSVDMIQAAFGITRELEWGRLQFDSELIVDGFVTKLGYVSNGLSLVSWNGRPVEGKGWIHRTVERAWKLYATRGQRTGRKLNKYPGYALNCRNSKMASVRKFSHEMALREAPPSREVDGALFTAVYALLIGKTAPYERARIRPVTSDEVIRSTSARKRRAAAPKERFAEAFLRKRVTRAYSSPWTSNGNRQELMRPISASDAWRSEHDITRSRRVCIKRPVSADRVASAYRRSFPSWSNPCFHGRALLPSMSAAKYEDELRGADALFDRRNVKINRETVPGLRIVGQVDRKFIVVADGSTVLYAVDQHAASERYIYERLLKQTTQDKLESRTLSEPRLIALSHKQLIAARRFALVLQRWGWKLRTVDRETVEMVSVPYLKKIDIALDSDGHLGTYLNNLADGAIRNATPRPILDAVATAACHSAVRFGDPLSVVQCRSLVGSLAECQSPFICAHGRPSIVPLAVFEE